MRYEAAGVEMCIRYEWKLALAAGSASVDGTGITTGSSLDGRGTCAAMIDLASSGVRSEDDMISTPA